MGGELGRHARPVLNQQRIAAQLLRTAILLAVVVCLRVIGEASVGTANHLGHAQSSKGAVPLEAVREPVPNDTSAPPPPVVGEPCNGCSCEFDPRAAEKSGAFAQDDPLQQYYKKGGLLGALTSAFGDKKTMYCHHLTSKGEPAVRAARWAQLTFKDQREVWAFLGKKPCCGRFAYDRENGLLRCSAVIIRDHDRTCSKETCIFVANNLECPTPAWAFK